MKSLLKDLMNYLKSVKHLVKNSIIMGIVLFPVMAFVVHVGASQFALMADNYYITICIAMMATWLPLSLLAVYNECEKDEKSAKAKAAESAPVETITITVEELPKTLEIPKAILVAQPVVKAKPKAKKPKKIAKKR